MLALKLFLKTDISMIKDLNKKDSSSYQDFVQNTNR